MDETKLAKAKRLYVKAKQAYFNAQSIMTDQEFDKLEDLIKKYDPTWEELSKTGEKVGVKVVTALLERMPSLNKVRAEDPAGVARYLKRIRKYGSSAVLMDKIDGSSVQLVYRKGNLDRVITRGDGTMGKDCSQFIPFLHTLPKKISTDIDTLVIRAEAVVTKADFQDKWAGAFDSSRAVASSLLNRQDVHPALKDLQFVALRVLYPTYSVQSGLEFCKSQGFSVVAHRIINLDTKEDWTQFLSKACKLRKEASKYELDGLVIFTNTNKIPKNTADKPDYAVAFKLNELGDAPTATILKVIWKASAFGVLVPKAKITPTYFGNVCVQYASLHNAKWAHARGAGVGAVVKVIQSGGIIPKIISVETKAKFKFPDPAVVGEYTWDNTETALELTDRLSSSEARTSIITRFFSEMELDGFSKGLAAKCVDAGHDTVSKVIKMTEEDFAELPGITDSASKYARSLSNLRGTKQDVIKLISASGCFEKGVGTTRLILLAEKAPHLLTATTATAEWGRDVKINAGQVFGETLVAGWDKFQKFLRINKLQVFVPKKLETGEGPLAGYVGSWTGYRDKQEERIFAGLGGRIVPFGSKTTVLFFLPNGKKSSKIDQASERGILTVSHAQPWMSEQCVKFDKGSK